MHRIALLMLLCCISARANPYFPTDDATWQTTTPAEAGADPAMLAEAVAYAEQADSNSLVILHGGRILSEHYWGGWSRTTTQTLYSASEAMVAALMSK